MELTPRKVIVLLIIVIVLMVSWQSISKVSDLSKKGILASKFSVCEKESTLNFRSENCNIKNCVDDDCSDEEEIRWEQQLMYAGENCADTSEENEKCEGQQ